MKRFLLILVVAAIATASAQTAPKAPATSSPKSATGTASTTKSAATAAEPGPWIKLPPSVPRVVHGPVKMPFALRYEEIKVGTGPEGEAGKIWHVKYTGWRAADGVKFDSWEEHGPPVMKDGKPQLGPDGKPMMGEPQPLSVPQGVGRVIPGFDYGLEGMKIGGKRRIFIPWQMAYGTHAIPDRPDHPGIPAKSDLIFDVELVDVSEMPQPAPRPAAVPTPHPGVPPGSPWVHLGPGATGQPSSAPTTPAAPGSSAAPANPATKPAAPAQPATNPQPSAPTQPAAPPQPATNPQPAPPPTASQPAPPTQPQQ